MSLPAILSGRRCAIVLGLAAAAQIVLSSVSFSAALARIPGDWRWMTQEPPGQPPTEGMAAFRALPRLLHEVPPDASVLVVSGLVAVQFEYYVLPRPMRLLQALPQQWIDLARQYAPDLADEVQRRRDRLEARGLLLTPARLVAAVPQVRYVLVAGPEPAELAAVRAVLQPIRALLGFALYVVRA